MSHTKNDNKAQKKEKVIMISIDKQEIINNK